MRESVAPISCKSVRGVYVVSKENAIFKAFGDQKSNPINSLRIAWEVDFRGQLIIRRLNTKKVIFKKRSTFCKLQNVGVFQEGSIEVGHDGAFGVSTLLLKDPEYFCRGCGVTTRVDHDWGEGLGLCYG